MRVLIVEPMKPPREQEIAGSLATMQAIVGGLIQAVYPFEEPIALVCNDEGKLLGLPMNRYVPEIRDVIAGTFFLCGAPPEGENFASLTEEQIQRYTRRFATPEAFIQTDRGFMVLRGY